VEEKKTNNYVPARARLGDKRVMYDTNIPVCVNNVGKPVKAWSVDRKFTHAILCPTRGMQSMDWRRATDKESHEYECWKKVRRSGINQLQMLVGDNGDHHIVACAHKPMTPAEWNTLFACANLQAVYEIEPVDLTVTPRPWQDTPGKPPSWFLLASNRSKLKK
jgi:hypothetical protein